MTNEEASFILANIDRRVCDDELNDALDVAIKALEQQSCEDCISREAMWKVVHECETHNSPSWVWREMLSQLPSVTPTRSTARWERLVDDFKKCSKCGKPVKLYRKHEYCPNCGAKMQEEEG